MSSDRINIFYELEIKEGKADELREIARQMVAFNGEANQIRWFITFTLAKTKSC